MTRKPRMEMTDITPEMAEDWLEHFNIHNRPYKPSKIAEFARDMNHGKWLFTGEGIKLGIMPDGRTYLQDGQNRLRAVVLSGETIRMPVWWDLKFEAQSAMDLGTKRTYRDQLHMNDVKNSSNVAAILRLAVPYSMGVSWTRSYKPTHAEMQEFLQDHAEAVIKAGEVAASSAGRNCPNSAVGLAYLFCARVAPDVVDEFFYDGFIEGIGLTRNSPIRALRNRFDKARRDGERIDADEAVRYIIRAWNNWRAGNGVTKIQKPKGGWSGHGFEWPK